MSAACIIGLVAAFVVGGALGVAGMAVLSFERSLNNDHE